jgi:hypothetical protein
MLLPHQQRRSAHPYDPVTYRRPAADPIGSEDEAWLAGGIGLISIIALSASFLWAHHWGPMTYTIVSVWIASTLAALIFGVRTLRLRGIARALACLALICVALSGLAVLATGVAYAAGYDVAGACGGG